MTRILFVLLFSATLHAQNPPPPQQITWTQNGATASEAQVNYIYRLTINEEGNPTPKHVPLLNVLCGGSDTAPQCSTALPIAGQSAIVTGNRSRLVAQDTRTNLTSDSSDVFVGDQGCIFRDDLYKVGVRTTAEARKQDLQALLTEFNRAKFKFIAQKQVAGNRFLVNEECVGYVVK